MDAAAATPIQSERSELLRGFSVICGTDVPDISQADIDALRSERMERKAASLSHIRKTKRVSKIKKNISLGGDKQNS